MMIPTPSSDTPHARSLTSAAAPLPDPNDVALLAAVRSTVQHDFRAADSAHDLDHLGRVERLALRLAAEELADPFIVATAALVHDYHRLDGTNGMGTTGAGSLGAVTDALHRAGVQDERTARIVACVGFTDRYVMSGDTVDAPSVEALVVRDADNLDAMGTIGIARAFAFGGVLGETLWAPDIPVRDKYDRGHAPSVIHHFHEKLLRLRDELQTPAAQAMGVVRHAEMVRFVEVFCAEWRADQ